MPIAGIGAAVAGDVGAGAALGAADVGAAAFGAADVGAVAGADALTATALAPDLTATIAGTGEAGLAAADATFGTFSPELFAANAGDVAAGGFGTDLLGAEGLSGASDLGLGATGNLFDTATGGLDNFFTTDASGGLFSGMGTGDFSTPFDPIGGGGGGFDTTGSPFGAGGQLSDIGTAGGGTAAAPPAGGLGEGLGTTPGTLPTEATGAGATDTGPIVSDTGIVNTGPDINQTFNQFTTTDQGASLPTDMASRVGATAVPTQSTTLESAFPGASQSITGETANIPTSFSAPLGNELNPTSMFNTGGLVPGTGVEAAPADFSAGLTPGATQTTFTPGGFDTGIETANVAPSAQMIAGAPDVTAIAGGPSPVLPGATNVGAGTVGPAAATPAAGTPAAAAGGGVSPLTALRYGTAGVNAITAGLNLSNALNQPSYPALLPSAYPGGPAAPFNGPIQPGFVPGTFTGGGIAGGLAGNRLVNGLVAGESPQRLAEQGIIPPARAARLQSTYNGIVSQYAAQLGVSPQSLSPGVLRMAAAQSLADQGLGGR